MEKQIPVITLDGPGGSGKGTISALLAQRLQWHFLDSGLLYRALAMAAYNHGVAFSDEASLTILAQHLDLQFLVQDDELKQTVLLEGANITGPIRTEQWGAAASQVGVLQKVRTALVARQRAFQQAPGLVADGRDMGTVIFPDALLKIFLTASQEERAQRRYNQLKSKGNSVKLGDLFEAIKERDMRDSGRDCAPLKPAVDAVVIDTTCMDVDAVFERVAVEAEARLSVSIL